MAMKWRHHAPEPRQSVRGLYVLLEHGLTTLVFGSLHLVRIIR